MQDLLEHKDTEEEVDCPVSSPSVDVMRTHRPLAQ